MIHQRPFCCVKWYVSLPLPLSPTPRLTMRHPENLLRSQQRARYSGTSPTTSNTFDFLLSTDDCRILTVCQFSKEMSSSIFRASSRPLNQVPPPPKKLRIASANTSPTRVTPRTTSNTMPLCSCAFWPIIRATASRATLTLSSAPRSKSCCAMAGTGMCSTTCAST